jgi:hypothetical protein
MLQVKSFGERLKMATREPNGVSVKLKDPFDTNWNVK